MARTPYRAYIPGNTLIADILDYLRRTNMECSTAMIRAGVGYDLGSAINPTLCLLAKRGWITRTRWGHYRIAYDAKDTQELQIQGEQVIVAATFDALHKAYPKAFFRELQKRCGES